MSHQWSKAWTLSNSTNLKPSQPLLVHLLQARPLSRMAAFQFKPLQYPKSWVHHSNLHLWRSRLSLSSCSRSQNPSPTDLDITTDLCWICKYHQNLIEIFLDPLRFAPSSNLLHTQSRPGKMTNSMQGDYWKMSSTQMTSWPRSRSFWEPRTWSTRSSVTRSQYGKGESWTGCGEVIRISNISKPWY